MNVECSAVNRPSEQEASCGCQSSRHTPCAVTSRTLTWGPETACPVRRSARPWRISPGARAPTCGGNTRRARASLGERQQAAHRYLAPNGPSQPDPPVADSGPIWCNSALTPCQPSIGPNEGKPGLGLGRRRRGLRRSRDRDDSTRHVLPCMGDIEHPVTSCQNGSWTLSRRHFSGENLDDCLCKMLSRIDLGPFSQPNRNAARALRQGIAANRKCHSPTGAFSIDACQRVRLRARRARPSQAHGEAGERDRVSPGSG